MKYHETGLPQDATVYKAFMMFTKNDAVTPAVQPRRGFNDAVEIVSSAARRELPLRTAQILNESGVVDPAMLSLALLRQMPKTTLGQVEKSFGAEILKDMEEAQRHLKTSFAYIDEASDHVKLLTLASAMASFEQFQKDAAKTHEALNKMAEDGTPEGGSFMMPVIPEIRVFDRLSDALYDKTSSKALEEAYRARLGDFRYASDRLKSAIMESGIAQQLPPELAMKLQQQDGFVRHPSFNETSLLDDPKVQAAYDVLLKHPMAGNDNIEAAIEVGEILTKHQSGLNSTAVAAGLLLTGLRRVTDEDIKFLKKKLDWDVLELLQNYGGEKDLYPHQLRSAPDEFKQFLVANQVAQIGRMKEGVSRLKDIISQQPDIPETERERALTGNLRQMLMMAGQMEEAPMYIGRTGAPELEKLFKDRLKELRDAIAAEMPKPPAPVQPFRRPDPPKPPTNANFDLD